MGGITGAFYSIWAKFLQQLIDVSRHRQSDVTLIPVDIDVHAQILSALPVHFYLIQGSKSMNEMVHTFVVVPHHSKVIYNEGKSDRAIVVAEHRGRARDGIVSCQKS